MSMIYLKKPGGIVKVHNKNVKNDIVDDCMKEKELMELKKSKGHLNKNTRAFSAPASASTMTGSFKSQSNQSGRTQNWLNEETITQLQNNAIKECHAVKRLCTPFLETENTFIKELEEYLAHKDLVELRKKELLHKRWTSEVYEPIRKQILHAIDHLDWRSLESHKREKHRQFLEHVNKKGFVFLRDDDNKDYYAETLKPIKIKTKTLNDPLHMQTRQRAEEMKTILRFMTGYHYTDNDLEQMRLPPMPLIPQGRHGVNSCHWLEMPHYNIDNMSRGNNRHRKWRDSAKTNIDFASWAQEDYDPKAAAKELQIPQKRMFTEHPPYGKPPVTIPHIQFIDPEDFADKIVNTNPFPQHMDNLRAEAEAVRELFQSQQAFEELEHQKSFSQESEQKC